MDQSRFIAKHVVNLPKSGIRDFFDIVAKMKDAISLGGGFSKPVAASRHLH
jgi:aminotransferase